MAGLSFLPLLPSPCSQPHLVSTWCPELITLETSPLRSPLCQTLVLHALKALHSSLFSHKGKDL